MLEDNLKKLTELTNNLPDFPNVVGGNGFKEYEMECGTCFAWNVFYAESICVTRWFSSYGTKFPTHTHEEKELIIIYKGSLIVTFSDGTEKKLGMGDTFEVAAGASHSGYFPEDTKFLTIMIPAAEYYPHE